MHSYFIHISQGSVETHLWCGEIYNNHMIANCLQNVSVKFFLKSKDINKMKIWTKVKCHIFYGPRCRYHNRTPIL